MKLHECIENIRIKRWESNSHIDVFLNLDHPLPIYTIKCHVLVSKLENEINFLQILMFFSHRALFSIKNFHLRRENVAKIPRLISEEGISRKLRRYSNEVAYNEIIILQVEINPFERYNTKS